MSHNADATMNPDFFTWSTLVIVSVSAKSSTESQEPRDLRTLHREREQRVLVTGPGRHDDELLPRLRAIGHRVRRIVIRDLAAPDLFARLCLEGVEVAVAAANEDEAAARHHRAAEVARRPKALRQGNALEQRVITNRG